MAARISRQFATIGVLFNFGPRVPEPRIESYRVGAARLVAVLQPPSGAYVRRHRRRRRTRRSERRLDARTLPPPRARLRSWPAAEPAIPGDARLPDARRGGAGRIPGAGARRARALRRRVALHRCDDG